MSRSTLSFVTSRFKYAMSAASGFICHGQEKHGLDRPQTLLPTGRKLRLMDFEMHERHAALLNRSRLKLELALRSLPLHDP